MFRRFVRAIASFSASREEGGEMSRLSISATRRNAQEERPDTRQGNKPAKEPVGFVGMTHGSPGPCFGVHVGLRNPDLGLTHGVRGQLIGREGTDRCRAYLDFGRRKYAGDHSGRMGLKDDRTHRRI